MAMSGDWVVQLEDGTHHVHGEIRMGLFYKLEVTWDGQVVASSPAVILVGEIHSFQHNGHLFKLRVRGLGLFGSLALSMDGVDVPSGRNLPVGRVAPMGAAALTPPPPVPPGIRFVQELNVQESEEVLGTEKYPLDNRFGDRSFTTVRQVSRESTNELAIDTSGQFIGTLGAQVLSLVKAEIEAQVSQQTGQRMGQKVTESQTLTFSVGPKSSVVYEVVWKRTVRSGERLYLSGGNQVKIPYRINYGLSCEIRTHAQAAGNAGSAG